MFNTASITTGSAGLANLVQRYVHKRALDQLKQIWLFRTLAQKEFIPQGNGNTAVWHRWNLPGTSTTSIPEGVGNAPQGTAGNRVIQATLSQFAEGVVLSDRLTATSPDQDILTIHADQLAYQAGYTCDTMFRALLDAFATVTGFSYTPLASSLTGKDLAAIRTLFRASNIHPFDAGYFEGLVHPFLVFDLENDPQVLGYGDTYKYKDPEKLVSLKDNDGSTLLIYKNVRLRESTNVNVSGSNYLAYFVAKGALGCVDLEGKGASEVVDPRKQRFKVNIHRGNGGSLYDPCGLLGGAAGYNFHTGSVVLDGDPGNGGGTARFKVADFTTNSPTV